MIQNVHKIAITKVINSKPDEYNIAVEQFLYFVLGFVNLPFDFGIFLLVWQLLLVHVAHNCELNERCEHEEETAGQVDVNCLHVADFGHVRIRRRD